jgi:predicted NBD/HSP70 family sugar kinase
MPGVVKQEQEVLVHAPNIGWSAVPLVRLLTERVDLPVYAENGAKTLGQAEMWIGAGRNVQHAVVTLWGTGVGAAIFTNGSIFRGVGSSAGEWGHTSIVAGGRPCRCGGAGCLEAFIGPEALLEEWDRTDSSVSLPADHDEEEWIDRLLAASASNPAAALVLERAATNFGIAAANLANLFDPELIVISGWVGLKLGPTLLPKIREALASQALGYTERRVSVELGHLGHDAVALGASTLVVEQLLSSGGTKFRSLRLSA